MSLESDLIYVLIADFNTKKEIGTYTTKTNYLEIAEITKKIKDILEDGNEVAKAKKNKLIFKNFAIFHTLNKNNVFLAAAINKNSKLAGTNTLFEFFEDIEHQSIIKFVDKQGELNNVGKQNLLYMVEKYFSPTSPNLTTANNSFSSIHEQRGDKILQVSEDVRSIQSDMKNGIKKIVNNVESVKELESRAERINNTSMLFKKDSETLRKKAECRRLTYKLIFIALTTIIAGFVIYEILS